MITIFLLCSYADDMVIVVPTKEEYLVMIWYNKFEIIYHWERNNWA